MKVLSALSLILALALAPAAAVARAADEFKDSPYYPMQVGAAWNYKAGDSKFSLKVADHRKIGTTMCRHVETLQDGKPVGSEDVFVKDDGVYRLASDDKQVDPPVLILKLPPKQGEAWTVDSKADTKTGREPLKGTFKTADDKAEVTVPAGKFTAVLVTCDDLDANGAKYAFKTYYAKDVGMVKQEIEAGGLKVVIELEKYEAGK